MRILRELRESAWILQPFLSSDINECSNGTHNCHAAATCTNTEGSFTCACNSGWNGDGVNCTGRLCKMCSLSNVKVHFPPFFKEEIM